MERVRRRRITSVLSRQQHQNEIMRSAEIKEQSSQSNLPSFAGKRLLSVFVLLVGVVLIAIHVSGMREFALAFETDGSAPFNYVLTNFRSEPAAQGSGDFSKFPHTNQSHQRLPCLLCHRRESNSPRPVRSAKHSPCSGCHAQQFQAKGGPICTICHTSANPTPDNRALKPFPTLKSFSLTFAHAKHREVACSTCHKPVNRGDALSIPSGPEAHTSCFQCHTPRGKANGRDISSCGTCHKPGQLSRISISRKAFRAGFEHDQHRREGLDCTDCHKITSVTTRRGQITSPLPTEHPISQRGQSCETCHNDQRAFGTASFANCKRCHQGPTFRFR
jgi:c(7)-type cytochrome triheme protein